MTLEFNHMYVSFELQNTDTSAITEAVAIFSIRIFRKCRGGGARSKWINKKHNTIKRKYI